MGDRLDPHATEVPLMENRLREFRERQGTTEGDLADVLDVSKQTITAIEKGKYDPSLPLAKAIARHFLVAVEDVFPTPPSEAVLTRATFVMTDVEGSTALVQKLGEHYVELLRQHRDLIVETFMAHAGRIVDDTGDAAFAAFNDPDDAIRASLAAQRAVAAADWPGGVQLKIRIGIHTGEAYLVGNRFVGLAVHEAARVCDSASGGQILVSEAAATESDEVEGTTFSTSADYSLKGVGDRRLYIVR
jgi:class 3 adenylate cyclase